MNGKDYECTAQTPSPPRAGHNSGHQNMKMRIIVKMYLLLKATMPSRKLSFKSFH